MKLSVITVEKYKNELEHFDGYLPQPLLSYIDKNKYYKSVSNSKSKDKIYQQINNAQRFTFEEHIKDFADWLKANPKYSDIVKQ